MNAKITPDRLRRRAIVYVRQSSMGQVIHNQESQRRQYGLVERAHELGFHDVIGTGSIIGLDERVHAKIDGENCYGPAKLRMVSDWLSKSGFERGHVRFYSDHASDAPVFEWADEPVAVNPHAKLAKLAATRGWTVEDWS